MRVDLSRGDDVAACNAYGEVGDVIDIGVTLAQHRTNQSVWSNRLNGSNGKVVSNHRVVAGGDCLVEVGNTGGVHSRTVPEPAHHPRLVDWSESGDPIAECLGGCANVVFEWAENLATGPTAQIL